ncbi:bifunctional RNase H/acid phosphatase [Actinocrinis puniceicyclus]|uniref:Bifunctional RNase H/acid phosphatase n=1 Tax=Actinocrinis puniceicyclus TaxID=977794 RepID=A0A8J8BEL8_9ACTN|nr:bifunctional RNase H/acid phosphatase [Actinocrinis puniceicyclus]
MRVLIVEADGASRGNPGAASYGAVVRDGRTGELLAELAEAIGRATNNVAEYRGVIAGLEAARRIDPQARVEVRMDSKLVVEQLSGRWQVKHPSMKPLAQRARELFPPNGVSFAWVPRSQNKHADRLANQALDAASRGEVWRAQVLPAAGEAAHSPRPVSSAAVSSQAASPAASPAASLAPVSRPAVEPRAPAAGSADLGAPTRLLLLRHGPTALTGEKRFSGVGADPELTEQGLAQARAAARRLAGPHGAADPRYGRVDAVITSPLRRARQTALAVAEAAGMEPRVEQGFRELHFGVFEALTFAEARAQYPDELAAFFASTAGAAPGGESVDEVASRAAAARDRALVRFARKTVLIVTHVTPIKTLLCQALGAPLTAVHRMELSAASLSVIDYYDDGVTNVRCVNDTAHLYDTGHLYGTPGG